MAGGRWDEAAAEVVQAPVTDAVPLARRKDGWWLYYLAGGGCFAVVVFLYQFGVIPGPTLLAYVLGAIPMSVLFQLSLTPVFAVLTPTGIQVTSGARWRPRPVAPVLGPLDPRVVSGPTWPVRQRVRHRRPAAPGRAAAEGAVPADAGHAARGRIGLVTVPNVLATRYAADDLVAIWSPEHKIVLERQLWIAVLRAQRDLGVAVPDGVVEAYEDVVDKVDLESIAARERVTRHDVKARIEEFSALAGHEHIHKGMTSRDLTENVEQLQVRQSLALLRDRAVATLARLARLAAEHETTVMAGRSHNVAAQATTLGKRFASAADELLIGVERVEELLARYPLRGIKGPMGTAQDMLDLLDGDEDRLADLEQRVAGHLGFERVLTSVGQVYPRSLDFDVLSAVVQLVAAPSNLATTIRLMAGNELVTEGFAEGQVGSSAMPHKMNTRSCERVNGLAVVTRGYLSMVGELAGDQWNEGDVSCSVVRRVALPDAFFAADGLFQTFLTVLDEFGAFPAVIQRELDRYLPFLATTKVLMAAVRRGVGREAGHEAIKQAAVGTALAMRQGQARQRRVRQARRRRAARPHPRRHRRPRRRADRLHRRGARPDPGRGPGRRGPRLPPPRRRGVLTRRHPLTSSVSGVRASLGGDSPYGNCRPHRRVATVSVGTIDTGEAAVTPAPACRFDRTAMANGDRQHDERGDEGGPGGDRRLGPLQRELVDGHQEGGAEGRADPLAGLERPAGGAAHRGRDVSEGEGEVGGDHAAATDAGEEHRGRERPPQVAGFRDDDEGRDRGAGHHHAQRDQRDPSTDPAHQPTRDEGRGGGADRERGEQQGGLHGGQPLALLQVHRQHQEDAGEAGEVERADGQPVGVPGQPSEQRDVEERWTPTSDRTTLPADERPGEREHADQQQQRQPRAGLHADEGVEHGQHGEAEQQRAHHVDPRVPPLRRGIGGVGGVPRDQPEHEHQRDQPDRDVHQEQPPPALLLAHQRDDRAADQRPGRRGEGDREAEQAERATALRPGEELLDQPGVLRREEAGAGTLDQPRDHDPLRALGQADGGAGGDEADQPERHQAPATVRVAEPAPGHQRETEGERVAGHDPLHGARAGVEAGPDRGDRDVDDRDVEQRHEADQEADRQDAPAARVGLAVLAHRRQPVTTRVAP